MSPKCRRGNQPTHSSASIGVNPRSKFAIVVICRQLVASGKIMITPKRLVLLLLIWIVLIMVKLLHWTAMLLAYVLSVGNDNLEKLRRYLSRNN